jgi:hypothetical protein
MDNAGMCTKYVRRHFEIVHKDGESWPHTQKCLYQIVQLP